MINSTPTDIFTSLNPNQSSEASRSRNISDMGSDDFMTLMIAQMKHQDPTKPMDQMAFMSQLAEFSSLSGIQELNGAFGELSTNLTGAQAVQASSLVGRSVAMDTQVASLTPVVATKLAIQFICFRQLLIWGGEARGESLRCAMAVAGLSSLENFLRARAMFRLCGTVLRQTAVSCLQASTAFRRKLSVVAI